MFYHILDMNVIDNTGTEFTVEMREYDVELQDVEDGSDNPLTYSMPLNVFMMALGNGLFTLVD